MNRPCSRCGRIITVPDIPLPAGYTQKCHACGFDNKIGESFDDPSPPKPRPVPQPTPTPKPQGNPPQRSNPAATTGSGPFPVNQASAGGGLQISLEKMKRELQEEFDQKLRAMSARIGAGGGAGMESRLSQASEFVLEGRALLCTNNLKLLRACESALSGGRIALASTTNVDEVLAAFTDHPPEIMLLDHQILITDEKGRSVLPVMKGLPLSLRRYLNIVLLSHNIPTGESHAFYQWSFDFNIHLKDVMQLEKLLHDLMRYKREILTLYLKEGLPKS